jgi:cyclopropane-fatty-acyl-phospholipid synthase
MVMFALMMEKSLFNRIAENIRVGGVDVTYWDGQTKHYGPDSARFHLIFRHPRAIRAILRNMTLGFGEGYMKGDIEIEGSIIEVGRIVSDNTAGFSNLAFNRFTRLAERNRPKLQARQIQRHYDLGNDFYKLWLDDSLTYSCAYFRTPSDTLEQAQSQKVDHILRKLQLSKDQELLDIGSGWGQLLIRAAQDYGVRGHGITLSKEQHKHSLAKAAELGLSHLLTFKLINYQDLAKQDLTFDRIVSVGMYEHVGRKNHKAYFSAVNRMLKPGGISVLHTITNEIETAIDPWIDKYIFPGGYIPSLRETISRLPEHNFKLVDYENLRVHYANTTEEWLKRFDAHKDDIIAMYDEQFYRMWRLYLGGSASGFRYGDLSLSQLVMTKGLNNSLPLTREFLYANL